jgi:hypothetical protein
MPAWFGTWFGASAEAGGSGAGYLVSDLILEARTLVDDDHDEEEGWVATGRWMTWLNWAMQALAQRMVQFNQVRPPVTETEFTGPDTTLTGVLSLLGVLDQDGNALERLETPEPLWTPRDTGPARGYSAHGGGDSLALELDPQDTRTYRARYFAQPTYVTDVDQRIVIPQGFEERLVLEMASYAHVKESARSAAIRDKIAQADARINFALFGRHDGGAPRVRRLPRTRFR